MRVQIEQHLNQWCLVCLCNDQVICAFATNKLIEVIDLANQLQLHIDNIDELPLPQYKIGDYNEVA